MASEGENCLLRNSRRSPRGPRAAHRAVEKRPLSLTIYALHAQSHAKPLRHLKCELIQSRNACHLVLCGCDNYEAKGRKGISPPRIARDLLRTSVKHVAIVLDAKTRCRP